MNPKFIEMKKFVLFLPLLFLLTACPVGLKYAPGKVATEPVDTRLIGTWEAESSEFEIQKVTIKKKTANEFSVQVLERGEMYYLYQVVIKSASELEIGDISLLDGGTDALTDTESLRKQISNSKDKEEFKNISKFVLRKV